MRFALAPIGALAAAALLMAVQQASCYDSDAIADLLGRSMSALAGQKYESSEGVPEAFIEYALNDATNEDLGHATPQMMIARAGFNHSNHYTLSDDGYITQLIRIINPLADQSQLKQPPVMLLQGGITDVSIWVWPSVVQHHPERWPRKPGDGPMTSWNRSLALTLANNGYDVWLVSHRGANEQNQGHIDLQRHEPAGQRKEFQKNDTLMENWLSERLDEPGERKPADVVRYWNFTFDELAEFEVTVHIDKVLSVTGASKVTLVPMSFSTIYAPMALARHPHYQRRLHNVVVFGPIISNKGTNTAMTLLHNTICKHLPDELGTMLLTEMVFSQPMRDLALLMGRLKDTRYSFVEAMLLPLAGPSARFRTLLEPGVYGHILMPTGFKMIKHYCQIVTASKMRRFDHGVAGNLKAYGSLEPPDYNLAKVDYGNWLLVSAGNDVLATPKSVRSYMRAIKSKPYDHIFVSKYNHLDLWAAIDNDVTINLPVLNFLDNYHLPPAGSTQDGS